MRWFGYRWWVIAGVTLFWLTYFFLVYLIVMTHPDGSGDYIAYFNAVQRLKDGEPLYSGISGFKPYIYPPLFAQALRPTVDLGNFELSASIWYFINVLLLMTSIALLYPHIPTKRSRLLLWIALPFFTPLFVNFLHGQVSVLLFACIVWAWVAKQRNYPIATGILIAVAAWIKVYPAILVAYFLWRRDWKVTSGVILATIILIPFQIAGVGWDNFTDFFSKVLLDLSSSGQLSISHSNHSIYGFAARLFIDTPYVKHWVVSPVLMSLTRWGLLLFTGGVTIWSVSQNHRSLSAENRLTLEFGIVLLMMLFATTSVTPSGLIIVYFMYVALAIATPPRLRHAIRWISIISFFLISVEFLIILGYLDVENELPALAFSLPFFGMLMLWGTGVYLLNLKDDNQSDPVEDKSLTTAKRKSDTMTA